MKNNKELHLKNIKKIIENLNLLRIRFDDIKMVQYEYNGKKYDNYYCIISLYGGLNGCGNWNLYIEQIKQILLRFCDPHIVKLETDSLDDVWHLEFSIHGYGE